jgi:hypothetical protein
MKLDYISQPTQPKPLNICLKKILVDIQTKLFFWSHVWKIFADDGSGFQLVSKIEQAQLKIMKND